MGYGKNLQAAIGRSGMSVRQVAIRAGIRPTTLYSIIRRDSPVQFYYAIRLAEVLKIELDQICKHAPGSAISRDGNSDEGDCTEKAITGYFQLDERGKRLVLGMIEMLITADQGINEEILNLES